MRSARSRHLLSDFLFETQQKTAGESGAKHYGISYPATAREETYARKTKEETRKQGGAFGVVQCAERNAFENRTVRADVELTVRMLNINYGHNKELMEKSRVLAEYAELVAVMRDYILTINDTQAAETTS